MKKRVIVLAAGLGLLAAAAPMQANDVKAGVDAWSRGEFDQAVERWRGPATRGDADAQFNLGQAYKLGRGVPVDLAQAEEWYRRAAAQGHPQAGDNYGLALFQNNKRAEAVPWLEKSAARGESRAQFVLGTMLFNGDVMQKDWVRAYALIVRANATGLPQAAQTLAQMDRYIGTAERQQGLTLARRYEAEAGRPQLASALPATVARADPPAPRPTASASVATPPPAKPVVARVAPPAPTPRAAAPTPRAVARADGGWRVQLGAFRDNGNARALWSKVSGIGGLSGTQPYYVKSGAVTRLLVGPFGSSAEAARACVAVKRSGNACLPTKG